MYSPWCKGFLFFSTTRRESTYFHFDSHLSIIDFVFVIFCHFLNLLWDYISSQWWHITTCYEDSQFQSRMANCHTNLVTAFNSTMSLDIFYQLTKHAWHFLLFFIRYNVWGIFSVSFWHLDSSVFWSCNDEGVLMIQFFISVSSGWI